MDNFITQKLFFKYGFVNFVRRPWVCAQPPVYLLFLLFGIDKLSHRLIYYFFSLASTGSATEVRFFIDYFLKIFIASSPKGCENLQKTPFYSSFAHLQSVFSYRGGKIYRFRKQNELPLGLGLNHFIFFILLLVSLRMTWMRFFSV
jgi:hypothetical protein